MMTVMAVLSLLGAPALISARQQYLVDSVAEDIISTVRQAQNNAISIKSGTCADGRSTRAWYASVSGNNYRLGSVCYNGSLAAKTIDTTQGGDLKQYSQVVISTESNYRVYFSTPFARSYLYNESSIPTSWSESSFFERDIVPNNTGTLDGGGQIEVSLGRHKRILRISPSGDISANE